MTRLLLALIMATMCVAAPAAEPGPTMIVTLPAQAPKPDIKPLDPFSSHGLEVTFTLDAKSFPAANVIDGHYAGGQIQGQYTMRCLGDSGFIVYSPLYNPLTPKPGEVRVFDSSGKLVAELLNRRSLSWQGETQQIMVYPGDFLGSHFSVWPLINDSPGEQLLPPGDYKAQFVLYSYVVIGEERLAKLAANPDRIGITTQENEFDSGKQVIAASKLVAFKIARKP